jgi:hypothetical protein
VGRVVEEPLRPNLRPIVNRPSDGALDASGILSNIRGTGRLAIGRRLATRPTSESGFFDPVAQPGFDRQARQTTKCDGLSARSTESI